MQKQSPSKRISKVEVTDDVMTGRGGLALFSRYVANLEILSLQNDRLGMLRKSSKGLSVTKLFLQVFLVTLSSLDFPLRLCGEKQLHHREHRDNEQMLNRYRAS